MSTASRTTGAARPACAKPVPSAAQTTGTSSRRDGTSSTPDLVTGSAGRRLPGAAISAAPPSARTENLGVALREPRRDRLAADEGGEVTGGDEGAVVVNRCLHLLLNLVDDFRPGAAGLVLVEVGPAGHEVPA